MALLSFSLLKRGTIRFFVDYRALNSLTVKKGCPLPQVEGSLGSLCEARYFSKKDFMIGYNLVHVDKKAILKTFLVLCIEG